ncbi:MAG: class I SAM-dependent methyltransferase [Flavobacteriaceae bacterium]|nr:class I SAM-dependent methyltransferase [Flavobacteriaceae bacterium]
MDQQLVEIREKQRESWNKFSSGWKKWDDLVIQFLHPMGEEIIQQLHLKVTDTVLDIAGGTGEPGLTIASKISSGKVIITDLAEDMLTIAAENAAKKKIKNVETQICDVCELPFDDNSFDAISCRFGFMFFPDLLLATKEMVRVLKPGGRVAVSVWGVAQKNFWVTAIGGTINQNMQLTPPPPGAPGMFRCAESGMIQNLFEKAGLKNTSEKEVISKLDLESAEVYWEMMTDVAAPFVAALSKAEDEMKEKIKQEVFQKINEKFGNATVSLDGSALVIAGEK